MRVHICAVGRLRQGPERALVDDYLDRFGKAGRALGLGPAEEREVEDRRGGGMAAEAVLLGKAIPAGAAVLACDERGRMLSSPEFAALLARFRDSGRQDLAILVGGADGLDPALRDGADEVISFGRMVWPHLLVRAMLAEQLYRAAAILGHSPYHRA